MRLRRHLRLIYVLCGAAILISSIVLLYATTTGPPEDSSRFWQSVLHSVVLASFSLVAAFVAYLFAPRLKQFLVGPKLVTRVDSPAGTLTKRQNHQVTRYYHLRIENKRTFAPATNTVVRLIGFSKRSGDGEFEEVMVDTCQFTWQFPQIVERRIRLDHFYKCDICYANEQSDMVTLELYETRIGFPGFIKGGEAMRLMVIVAADNFVSEPHYYEIAWNGKWSKDDEDMKEHLKFTKASSLM